jgi:hypothetical protein
MPLLPAEISCNADRLHHAPNEVACARIAEDRLAKHDPGEPADLGTPVME